MDPIAHDEGPPSGWMQAQPAEPQPVTISVSVQPRFTNSNRQDGLTAILAGVVLGLAVALYVFDEDRRPGRKR